MSVSLSPKAFLLLEALVAGAPVAVCRADLYRVLWGETVVDEANLPSLIHEVRHVLGDDARCAQFVKTVHRYGYRFVATVTCEVARAGGASQFCVDIGGSEIILEDGANLVGRDRSAVVRLEESHVSRRHASIVVRDGIVTVEDLGSKNGTFVRGQRTNGAARLFNGDEVQIASIILILRERAAEATDTDAFPLAGRLSLV